MQVWLRREVAPLLWAPPMRSLAAVVLLSLALAGAAVLVYPADVEACAAGTDVLSVQAVTGDDALDDGPWDLAGLTPLVDALSSPAPYATPARHTPLLHDQRRHRPPRA